MVHAQRVYAVGQPAHLEPAGRIGDGAVRSVGRIGPGHERRGVIPVPKHDVRTVERLAAHAVAEDARHHAFSHLERDSADERVGHRSAGLPIRHEHGPTTRREAHRPDTPGVPPDREAQPPVADVEGAFRQTVEGEVRADELTPRTLRQGDVAVPDLHATEFRALLVEPERTLDVDDVPIVPRAERDAEHRLVVHLVTAEPEAVRVPELPGQQHVRVGRVENRGIRVHERVARRRQPARGQAPKRRQAHMSADAALGLQRREVFGIQRALVFRERERHFAAVFGPHRGLERLASLFPDGGERLSLARIVEAGRGDFDAQIHEPHRPRRDLDSDRHRLPRRHFVGLGDPVRVSDALHADAVLPGAGGHQRKEAVRRREVGLHGLAGGVQKADETARDERAAIGFAYRAVDPLGGGGRSEGRGDEGHREA